MSMERPIHHPGHSPARHSRSPQRHMTMTEHEAIIHHRGLSNHRSASRGHPIETPLKKSVSFERSHTMGNTIQHKAHHHASPGRLHTSGSCSPVRKAYRAACETAQPFEA